MWDCTKCYYCRTYFDVFNMNDKKCLFLSDLLVALKKNILNPGRNQKILKRTSVTYSRYLSMASLR